MASSGLVALPNGWYRLWLTATSNTGTTIRTQFRLQDAAGASTYTGSGTAGLYLFGAQLGQNSFMTSYIPTTNATATRAADVAEVNSSGFGSVLPQPAQQGTLLVDYTPLNADSTNGSSSILDLNDGTGLEVVRVRHNAAGSGVTGEVVAGGVTQTSGVGFASVLVAGQTCRLALGFAPNDVALSVNGSIPASDASAAMPRLNQMLLGRSVGATTPMFGWLRHVSVLTSRLSNPELQSRSA